MLDISACRASAGCQSSSAEETSTMVCSAYCSMSSSSSFSDSDGGAGRVKTSAGGWATASSKVASRDFRGVTFCGVGPAALGLGSFMEDLRVEALGLDVGLGVLGLVLEDWGLGL